MDPSSASSFSQTNWTIQDVYNKRGKKAESKELEGVKISLEKEVEGKIIFGYQDGGGEEKKLSIRADENYLEGIRKGDAETIKDLLVMAKSAIKANSEFRKLVVNEKEGWAKLYDKDTEVTSTLHERKWERIEAHQGLGIEKTVYEKLLKQKRTSHAPSPSSNNATDATTTPENSSSLNPPASNANSGQTTVNPPNVTPPPPYATQFPNYTEIKPQPINPEATDENQQKELIALQRAALDEILGKDCNFKPCSSLEFDANAFYEIKRSIKNHEEEKTRLEQEMKKIETKLKKIKTEDLSEAIAKRNQLEQEKKQLQSKKERFENAIDTIKSGYLAEIEQKLNQDVKQGKVNSEDKEYFYDIKGSDQKMHFIEARIVMNEIKEQAGVDKETNLGNEAKYTFHLFAKNSSPNAATVNRMLVEQKVAMGKLQALPEMIKDQLQSKIAEKTKSEIAKMIQNKVKNEINKDKSNALERASNTCAIWMSKFEYIDVSLEAVQSPSSHPPLTDEEELWIKEQACQQLLEYAKNHENPPDNIKKQLETLLNQTPNGAKLQLKEMQEEKLQQFQQMMQLLMQQQQEVVKQFFQQSPPPP